jgi:integrase
VLSQAVDDGLLAANPAFRLGRYYRQAGFPKIEIRPFTRDEAQQFLAAAREHAPREHPLFLTALRTGLRLGELLALQWGDIDFSGRFIEVRRNLVAGRLTTPKSGKTRRVDASRQLTTALRQLLIDRKSEKLRRGWRELPEWVFCTDEGGPLDGDNLRHRVFYRVVERAGLRRVRFHDLRHTFASLLIQQGESLAYVKDQLGHSSIQLTVDTYGHLIPGANRQAVDRLDDTDAAASADQDTTPQTQQTATPAQLTLHKKKKGLQRDALQPHDSV